MICLSIQVPSEARNIARIVPCAARSEWHLIKSGVEGRSYARLRKAVFQALRQVARDRKEDSPPLFSTQQIESILQFLPVLTSRSDRAAISNTRYRLVQRLDFALRSTASSTR